MTTSQRYPKTKKIIKMNTSSVNAQVNRNLLNKIHQAFEDIFEYNDYTWDEIEFRIAYKLQSNLMKLTCDNELYTCDKQLLKSTQSYLSFYSINDTVRNVNVMLNGIIHFDYEKMKQDNEQFYIELNNNVLNPKRIETMATTYFIDFFDYLDAIM